MGRALTNPIVTVVIITLLSLGAAVVLFHVLSSTATIRNEGVEIGGAAGGFVVVWGMLFRGHKSLDERLLRTGDLARVVARHIAQSIVVQARNDLNPVAALNTSYDEQIRLIPVYFKSLGAAWATELVQAFKDETLLRAKENGTLRDWEPEAAAAAEEIVVQ